MLGKTESPNTYISGTPVSSTCTHLPLLPQYRMHSPVITPTISYV